MAQSFEPGMECPGCGGYMDFRGVDEFGDGVYICQDEFCLYQESIDSKSGKPVGTGW